MTRLFYCYNEDAGINLLLIYNYYLQQVTGIRGYHTYVIYIDIHFNYAGLVKLGHGGWIASGRTSLMGDCISLLK